MTRIDCVLYGLITAPIDDLVEFQTAAMSAAGPDLNMWTAYSRDLVTVVEYIGRLRFRETWDDVSPAQRHDRRLLREWSGAKYRTN